MRTSIRRAITLAFAIFFIGVSSAARAVPEQQDRDEQLEAVLADAEHQNLVFLQRRKQR